MSWARGFFSGRMKFAFPILWLYLFCVFVLHLLTRLAPLRLPLVAALLGVSGVGTFVLLAFFQLLFQRVSIDGSAPSRKRQFGTAAVLFAVTFLLYGLYLSQFYPGGITHDMQLQYDQAISGIYNDWHPVLHTLLFFTLPLKLVDSLGFALALQILWFCLAFSYLLLTLIRSGIPRLWLAVICLYVWFNPYLATNLMVLWKDAAFLIFALVLTGQYVETVCSQGHWLESPLHRILFGLTAFVCCIMRHNAILFVGPLVLWALVRYGKTNGIRLRVIAALCLCSLGCNLLYSALDAEKPGSRVVETVGLPVSIWCNVMQRNPDALPEQTQKVMYEIAPKEVYENDFDPSGFNSIKFTLTADPGQGLGRINEMSYGEVLNYTWQCLRYAPRETFEGFACLTAQVWGINGSEPPSLIGVTPQIHPLMWWFISTEGFCTRIPRILFGSLGFEMLVLLAIALAGFVQKRWSLLHAAPLLCHNFGTMLLLTGPDYRFFLLSIPLWMVFAYLIYRDPA